MTDLTHDPILDEARRARLEQLQSRRGGSAPTPPALTARIVSAPIAGSARPTPAPTGRTSGQRRKRPHPAKASRIAAAGIGMASMLGLVGVMGFASHQAGAQSSNDSAGPDGTPALVLAHDDSTGDTTGDTSGDTSAADGSTPDGSTADSPASSIHTKTKSGVNPSVKANTKTNATTTVKPKTTTKTMVKPKTVAKPKVTVAPKPPVTTTPKATTHGSR